MHYLIPGLGVLLFVVPPFLLIWPTRERVLKEDYKLLLLAPLWWLHYGQHYLGSSQEGSAFSVGDMANGTLTLKESSYGMATGRMTDCSKSVWGEFGSNLMSSFLLFLGSSPNAASS